MTVLRAKSRGILCLDLLSVMLVRLFVTHVNPATAALGGGHPLLGFTIDAAATAQLHAATGTSTAAVIDPSAVRPQPRRLCAPDARAIQFGDWFPDKTRAWVFAFKGFIPNSTCLTPDGLSCYDTGKYNDN